MAFERRGAARLRREGPEAADQPWRGRDGPAYLSGYAALGSVFALKEELDHDGVVSKVRVDRFGRSTGGKPLARGALYLMLQNRVLSWGDRDKENSYPGEHETIVDLTYWTRYSGSSRLTGSTGRPAPKLRSRAFWPA